MSSTAPAGGWRTYGDIGNGLVVGESEGEELGDGLELGQSVFLERTL
jgi:hypothetical protein